MNWFSRQAQNIIERDLFLAQRGYGWLGPSPLEVAYLFLMTGMGIAFDFVSHVKGDEK